MGRRTASAGYLALVCTLLAGTVLSVAAFAFVDKHQRERVQAEFEHKARGHAGAIRDRVYQYQDALHSIAGLYAASREVDRQEFREFVARTLSRLPGIQALIWAPRVPHALGPALEAAARKDGYRNFRITERDARGDIVSAARREAHFPIYYAEPTEGNESLLGLDLVSDAVAWQAMERARDTSAAAAAVRVAPLGGTGDKVGVLVAVPMSRKGSPHQSLGQRRDNLQGFAVGMFKIGDVVEATLKDIPAAGIDFYLFDRTASEGEQQLLYAHSSRLRNGPPSPIGDNERKDSAGLTWGMTFDLAGRQWSLRFHPAPEFLAAHGTWQAWGILVAGLVVTAMLGGYLLVALGRAVRVERLVKERTAELATANQDLARQIAERDRAEEALRESEKRYRTLLEASADAVIVYDASGHVTYLNPAFHRTFGWSQEELLGKRIEFVPEASRQETKAAIERLRLGEQVLGLETRRRTKDGTLLDVLVSASPLQDAGGNYAGAFVTFRDIGRRKRAEEALKESEERYRDLVEHSDDYICTHDLEGTILSANLAMARRFGSERPEEFVGRRINEFLAPGVGHLFDAYLDAVAKEGHADGLMKVVTRSGEERILEYRNSLRTEGLEKPIVRGRAHDVTERLQAERALSRRTEQMQALRAIAVEITRELDLTTILRLVVRRAAELVNANSGVVYLWDETDRVLSARAWHGLGEWMVEVKLNPGDGVAGTVAQRREGMIVNDYRTSAYAKPLFLERTDFTAVIAEPLLYHDRLVGVLTLNKTGQLFTEQDHETLGLLAAQAAIAIENARLYTAIGESRSKLEELHRLGSAIQETMTLQERLNLILKGAQTVLGFDRINILLADSENRMLKAVASVGVDEPLEQIQAPLGPEGGGIAKAFLEQSEIVWDGDGPVPVEWRLAHPYAEISAFRSKAFVDIPLLVRGQAIGVFGADNKLSKKAISPETVRLLRTYAAQAALAIDNARLYEAVTEYARELERKVEERTSALKEAQVQLIQSGKLAAVGTLAAGVAHELNQPLMVIRGYAQELQADRRLADEETREDLRRIEAQTTRMGAIINHLRDFSRQSKGKRQGTDLSQVVTQALTFLGQQLKTRNVEVVRELDPVLPAVWADPLQIEQVLLNLVTNARDAMEKAGKGTITIRTEVAGDGRIALSVTDTGIGIPPDLQARIFDPFFTTKEIGKGTGLGLSICHGIMEEHGGEIRLESPVADGRGARFTLLLPIALRVSRGSDAA